MDSRFSKPKQIFNRVKDRFGEKMEKYPVKKNSNPETNFRELEYYRDKSRKESMKYAQIFRFFTSIGILAFIYFLFKLAGQDILRHFY